jgi:uncharacterized membrane protein
MNPYNVLAVSTQTDINDILALIILYMLAITVILFVVHLIITYMIYKDAEKHSMSAGAWAIVFLVIPFVFWFFGILWYALAILIYAVVYVIARGQGHGYRRCVEKVGGKCKKWA